MRWLIVAGGTGGHIVPGLAIAERLLAMNEEVFFVAGMREVERHLLGKKPFSVYHLDVEGFVGRPIRDKVRAVFKMLKSLKRARDLIKEVKPSVIISEGGYVSVPVVVAGKIEKIPCCLHEQNVIPGKANQLLGRFVDRVFVSFEETSVYFPESKTVVSGNPVRKAILESRKREHEGRGLLVLGGSLGARFINELLVNIVEALFSKVPKLFVIHQTGFEDFDRVRKAYERLNLSKEQRERLRIYPFIDDMAWAYAQADLVLSRAGATTIAELIALEKPAILIPFPYATHGHQEKNAEVLVEAGSAMMFKQDSVEKEALAELMANLLLDSERLKKMSKNYEKLKKGDPAEIIISETRRLMMERRCHHA